MILAKPIIPDQFWILREDDRKIGNIQAEAGGFVVNINNQVAKVKTLNMLTQRVPINFENPVERSQSDQNQVNGYPTTDYPHNAIFDVHHQLPLWTQDEHSKSWLAAGWYAVKQHKHWKVSQCPKLIILQRYQYQGPFTTKQEAESAV